MYMRPPEQLTLDWYVINPANRFTEILYNTEISYNTNWFLMGLFGWPTTCAEAVRFNMAWLKLCGHSDANFYSNVETFLLFLAHMSNEDLNRFIESFYSPVSHMFGDYR